MSKPTLEVGLTTPDGKITRLKAVFDTGAYPSIVRPDALPAGSATLPQHSPTELRTAGQGGKLQITGATILTIAIGDRLIQDDVLISPDLVSPMLIGSKTMQAWDITIRNRNGKTKVIVGLDMRDPEITEVD